MQRVPGRPVTGFVPSNLGNVGRHRNRVSPSVPALEANGIATDCGPMAVMRYKHQQGRAHDKEMEAAGVLQKSSQTWGWNRQRTPEDGETIGTAMTPRTPRTPKNGKTTVIPLALFRLRQQRLRQDKWRLGGHRHCHSAGAFQPSSKAATPGNQNETLPEAAVSA
jgi:hypothetical protein